MSRSIKSNYSRIMVVSRTMQDSYFNKDTGAVMKFADLHRAQMVVFALHSHGVRPYAETNPPMWKDFFESTKNIKAVLIGLEAIDGTEEVQLWQRHDVAPIRMVRQFARGAEPERRKLNLMRLISSRIFGSLCVLICGEIGILRHDRASNSIADDYGILKYLRRAKVKTMIFQLHTNMRRFEQQLKKKEFSKEDDRTTISVWNRCNEMRIQSRDPWCVYRRGERIDVQEIPNSIRPDIRTALVQLH